MYADVALQIQKRSECPHPSGASRSATTTDKTTVLLVDAQNRVQVREIQTGIEDPNRVEVLSGLERGRSSDRRQSRRVPAGPTCRSQAEPHGRRQGGRRGRRVHVGLRDPVSLLHHHVVPDHRGGRRGRPWPACRWICSRHINIPVVVVATFYSGMPPEQIEADITSRFERFFTLGSGIDHIESRSLPGVSLIKIYFQPGTNPDSAVSTISNLAMAQLRRLPPGTLPPVVLKFDASSLPVCLITLKGQGLNETAVTRPRPVQGAQPDRERARRIGPAAFWRQVPPDPGLCRSGQAAGPPAEPDGRGAHGERCQHDPAGGRRADRPQGLQHLHQQPTAHDRGDQPAAAEDGRQQPC